MKTVAVLRAFPKDATWGKVLKVLSREFKVDCYIWDRQRDYVPIVENENISYLRCTIRAGFYNLSTLLKMLLFEIWLLYKLLFARLDFIHAIDLGTGLVGLCIAKLRKKYFIYYCIDPYYVILPAHWPKFIGDVARRIENFVISQADIFIITDLLRMPQHKGATPKTVVEIANGPMLEHLVPENNPDSGEFVVGYIGALIEGRNLLTVVDAIGELANDGVTMVIGGYGPIEHHVKERSKKYRNIRFIGEVPNHVVMKIEGTFDLFAYMCDPENEGHRWVSPNKLFESMALKKPIIVAKGTLVAKRVASFGNGLSIQYGSKDELKKAVLLLKNTPQLRREMGEKGKNEFEENWRPEIMEERLKECYAKLGR
ncbi:MAG: glycosyltransferase [Thermodesulfovibrionales bacterium]|nr:glycosyltransferase [Thermodesulfovibrionales bacterium]